MNSRERVLCALNHKEPDRVPLDIGGTIVSSITSKAYMNLRRYLGMPKEELRIFDHVQRLPYIDAELIRQLGIDVHSVQASYVSGDDQKYLDDGDYWAFYDRWGSKMRMPKVGGHYFDWVEFPIKDITMDELSSYKWPEPDADDSYLKLRDRAKYLFENTDYALAGTAVFGGGVFEQPSRMMGMENFLMSLAANEKFADAVMSKILDIYIECCSRYLDLLGEYLHVFVYWNDIAGQRGPLISPDTYRRMIKPKDKKLFDAVKKKTDAKIFYHCCGACRQLIGDLIETGVDILNPVQVAAKDMDTAQLKKEFGKDLTFWGGGVDTQRVLPYGTPQQVQDEVRRRIDDLAPGGGFVFATVHNIQNDVPPENIMAMIETLREYGVY
ncbi:MAG: uroporphyrinogen decarboxylase family protein [Planctomycetota bacterium]|jgi:uroporphyrinogen decarboxylase